MRYDKAVRMAEQFTKLSLNPDMRFEAQVNRGNYDDCHVIQIYKDKPAGIAAY